MNGKRRASRCSFSKIYHRGYPPTFALFTLTFLSSRRGILNLPSDIPTRSICTSPISEREATAGIEFMRGDGYQGPIIVKTSDNAAGGPERLGKPQLLLHRIWKKFNRELTRRAPPGIPFQQPSITTKQHYRIFPERSMLPVGWLDRDDIVVERFRPERFGDSYALREWYFLGDREVCRCEISSDPISTYGEWCPSLDAPPPQSIRQVREDLRIEYGKIDYAIDGDGVPILFDVNKTIGGGTKDSEWTLRTTKILSQGLHSLVARRTGSLT